jgi:hypothetical protein
MARFGTQEWCDAVKRLTAARSRPVAGATARFQYHIVDGPDGDIRYWEDTVDGRLQTLAVGEIPDPQFVLTAGYADWMALRRDGASLNEMRADGRVTIEGDIQAYRSLIAVRDAPWYAEHAAAVRAMTEW